MRRCQNSLSSPSSRKKGIAFGGGPNAILKKQGKEEEGKRKRKGKGME
jgi:hypothetical protein